MFLIMESEDSISRDGPDMPMPIHTYNVYMYHITNVNIKTQPRHFITSKRRSHEFQPIS